MRSWNVLQWRTISTLVFTACLLVAWLPSSAQAPAETQVKGPAILKHPAGILALQYVELVHANRMDDAMKLVSKQGQASWKSEPASERKASASFRKKMLPTRAELEASLQTGGVLIIEANQRATLNVIKSEQKTTSPGTVTATSTTVAIPLVMEGAQWKIAK